jgi:hypothetical protein
LNLAYTPPVRSGLLRFRLGVESINLQSNCIINKTHIRAEDGNPLHCSTHIPDASAKVYIQTLKFLLGTGENIPSDIFF